VTLYGRDPDRQPDIYGKIGASGVSIGTLDDMRVLYDGFDLCAPDIAVSMTINGRAGHPGDVPQHRHRPAAAGIRRGGRPRARRRGGRPGPRLGAG
jgi:hypothetical protein